MSLITCPDCARQISSEAAACPQCGRPLARILAAPQKFWERHAALAASARRLSWMLMLGGIITCVWWLDFGVCLIVLGIVMGFIGPFKLW